ncbi:hypothetical protein Arno162_9 [Pectobacterium phage Arno162]|uniref:Uncharacterized protein n=1 Tax=Pectobacterium phage Arno162 TaxID=2500577 RepID=A0A678ZLP9_9CAUD|nr:hypothetical protein Arno162_9 [Pectobacterium phage Arno162]
MNLNLNLMELLTLLDILTTAECAAPLSKEEEQLIARIRNIFGEEEKHEL